MMDYGRIAEMTAYICAVPCVNVDEQMRAVRQKWPSATEQEMDAAVQVAIELQTELAAEELAAADALKDEMERRRT